MKLLKIIIALSFIGLIQNVFAQMNQTIGKIEYDETLLYAEVKQVDQFFRRFNNEEDARGVKYDFKDPKYHNNDIRSKYFYALFDKYSILVTSDAKNEFSNYVLNPKNPYFLDFYNTEWYAEVSAKVLWNNSETKEITYYFKLEHEREGYKWVISNIYFAPFDYLYTPLSDSIKESHFLHPKSHEIDFINLPKEFRDPEYFSAYLYKDYQPDPLTLYLYELKKGNIKFLNVDNTKFHFLINQKWYFEIIYFNRNEINSGWLISNLLPVSEQEYSTLRNTFNSSK